uniref:SFRICE_038004 n=1 Tax=Spodoptera frugiperda TaxID=7108 RepID=A0A2H1WE26_SPOFR
MIRDKRRSRSRGLWLEGEGVLQRRGVSPDWPAGGRALQAGARGATTAESSAATAPSDGGECRVTRLQHHAYTLYLTATFVY